MLLQTVTPLNGKWAARRPAGESLWPLDWAARSSVEMRMEWEGHNMDTGGCHGLSADRLANRGDGEPASLG